MKIVEYVSPLGFDGRRRARHVRIEGKVVEFIVQYELKILDEWYPVVRYDTAHGFAHKDKLTFNSRVTKEDMPFDDFNLALTFAEKDLRDNWQEYRAQFLKEVDEK